MTRPKNKISSLLLNLALLAFVVRSLVPVGFMPGHNAGSTYPMVICSGAGPVTINVPADKLPFNPHPHSSHETMPCTYAQGLAQGMLLADYPQPVMPIAAEPAPVRKEISLSLKAVAKNYFSHGPPAFPA